MTREEYYIAPDNAIFEDIKASAIFLWERMGRMNLDSYEIAESVERIKKMQNIGDNTGYIVAMLDQDNKIKLMDLVTPETKVYLKDLLEFGGVIQK